MNAFVKGYNDYVAGLPLNHDDFEGANDDVVVVKQLSYEDGRFFGVYCETQGVNPHENWKFHVNQARSMGFFK